MISIGLWVAGFLGRTVTTKQAKRLGMFVAIPVIVILLVALTIGGKSLYDHGLRKQVLDEQKAKVADDTLAADREATENATARAEIAEAENDRLENAMADAARADPERPTREVGPVQQSYFDNLPKRR